MFPWVLLAIVCCNVTTMCYGPGLGTKTTWLTLRKYCHNVYTNPVSKSSLWLGRLKFPPQQCIYGIDCGNADMIHIKSTNLMCQWLAEKWHNLIMVMRGHQLP